MSEPYRVRHEVCPACGKQGPFETTLIGHIGNGPGRDPNKRFCYECGCRWYTAEITHPAVPESERPVYVPRRKT